MVFFRVAILITTLVFPVAVFAQVGPCGSGDTCPSGQICRGPEGSRLCYRTCNPAAASGATDACLEREVCGRPEGFTEDVCELGSSTSSGSESSAEEAPEEAPFEPITPSLGVPIPGASLSAPTRESGVVRVAFLGEYINAAYRYLSTIGLVIAIVMVVYGGFLYLGGSAGVGSIQRGKTIIIDSIIGMLLILSAYAILNIVNPDTVNLKTLELAFVNEEQLQRTIETPTGDPEADAGGASDPGNISGDCPVNLTESISTSPYRARDARSEQFARLITTRLRSSDRRTNVIETARSAAVCGLHMGSCGHTAEDIYRINGISGRGRTKSTISTDQVRFLMGINQDCVRNHPGDRECKRQARSQAYERFRSSISGWPNNWTRDLEPGDLINIYTAHSGGAGQHAAIFMGWAGNGRARLVNGAWSENVRVSVYCLTSECSNPYPLTKVWSPD